MTIKLFTFIEGVRKRALSILARVKKLQEEEYLLPPEPVRSTADVVRSIDIEEAIEGYMSSLGSLLPSNFCTSMEMKALRAKSLEASKIRRPRRVQVTELRVRVDDVLSAHIAELRVRGAIRDPAAELRELEAFEPGADRRSAFVGHRNWRACETGWRLRNIGWTYILKLETDGRWSGIITPPGRSGIFVGRLSRSLVEARGTLFDAATWIRQI